MAKRIVLFVTIIVLVFLFGCKSISEPAKLTSRMLDETACGPSVACYDYAVPEFWHENLYLAGQQVIVNALVETPNTRRFPLFTIQKSVFDAQRSISILKSIFGEGIELRQEIYSVKEIETDLKNIEKGEYCGISESTGKQIWLPYNGQIEEIARLKELLLKATDFDTYIPLTVTNVGFPIIDRVIKMSDGSQAYVFCTQNYFEVRRHRSCNIQLESWVLQGDATPGEEKHMLKNISITKSQATSIGSNLLSQIGLDSFALVSLERARATESYTYMTHGEGYLLTYAPRTEGCLPCYYDAYSDSPALLFSESDEETENWQQECIQILVTEEGILHFSWTSPKENVNLVNANVELLPFDRIQGAIINVIDDGISRRSDPERSLNNLLISRMVLSSYLIKPTGNDFAYVVPTWVIFLTTQREKEMHIDQTVLLINALDGSRICRWGDQ